MLAENPFPSNEELVKLMMNDPETVGTMLINCPIVFSETNIAIIVSAPFINDLACPKQEVVDRLQQANQLIPKVQKILKEVIEKHPDTSLIKAAENILKRPEMYQEAFNLEAEPKRSFMAAISHIGFLAAINQSPTDKENSLYYAALEACFMGIKTSSLAWVNNQIFNNELFGKEVSYNPEAMALIYPLIKLAANSSIIQ